MVVFSYHLVRTMPIINNFQKMELQKKLSNFLYYIENVFLCNNQSLKVFPEAPFYWELLIIGKVNVKRIG